MSTTKPTAQREAIHYHDDPRVQRVCVRLDPVNYDAERQAVQLALSFGDRIDTAIEIAVMALSACYSEPGYVDDEEASASLRGRLRAYAKQVA